MENEEGVHVFRHADHLKKCHSSIYRTDKALVETSKGSLDCRSSQTGIRLTRVQYSSSEDSKGSSAGEDPDGYDKDTQSGFHERETVLGQLVYECATKDRKTNSSLFFSLSPASSIISKSSDSLGIIDHRGMMEEEKPAHVNRDHLGELSSSVFP